MGNLGACYTHTHTLAHSHTNAGNRQIVVDTLRAIEGTTTAGNAQDDNDGDDDCSRFVFPICIRCDAID